MSEPDPPEAPVWLDNPQAAAWQSGWASGFAAAAPRVAEAVREEGVLMPSWEIDHDAWVEFARVTTAEELGRILWMTDEHGGFQIDRDWVYVNGAAIMPRAKVASK